MIKIEQKGKSNLNDFSFPRELKPPQKNYLQKFYSKILSDFQEYYMKFMNKNIDSSKFIHYNFKD